VCVRGASALDRWLAGDGHDVAAAIVWEPVLDGDHAPAAAGRARHARHYWDPERTLSAAVRASAAAPACVSAGDADLDVVWDAVFVYPPGVRWVGAAPPAPAVCGRTILRALPSVTAHAH
jgi:hypothetical protein